MYKTLVIEEETISLGQPTVGKEALSTWFMEALETRERLTKNLHYRFLVNRFLRDREWIETRLIIDQFYKDTNLPIPASQDVIKKTIKNGVADEAFGVGSLEDSGLEEDSVRIESVEITFGEGEIVVSKALAERLIAERGKEQEKIGSEPPEKIKRGGDKGEKEKTPVSDVPPEKTGEVVKKFKKIRLRVENIPSAKIADISRGVLIPISQEVGSFKLTLEINIED